MNQSSKRKRHRSSILLFDKLPLLILALVPIRWSLLVIPFLVTFNDRTTSTTALQHIGFRSVHPRFVSMYCESDNNNNGMIRMAPDSNKCETPSRNDINHSKIDPNSPFRSRNYPRIQPISFQKRKQHNNKDSTINKFWLPGQRTFIRDRFLQQQRKKILALDSTTMLSVVEWMDDIPKISDSSSVYSNIITLASLWDIVNKFLTQNTTSSSNTIQVIALPTVDGYVINQFVNMLQWLSEQLNHHSSSTSACPVTFNVSYNNTKVEFMTIPTITLTLLQNTILEKRDLRPPLTLSTKQTDLYNHESVTRRTKAWVQRILVDQTICPFTKSVTYSGQGLSDVNVPVGKIAYHTSSSTPERGEPTPSSDMHYIDVLAATCQLQSDVWFAIYDMLQAGPEYSMKQKLNGISSILLAAPGWDNYFDLWCSIIFPLLENSVQIVELTEQIGIVCFHPLYQTPDGRSFPGFGHMHSVPRLQQWLSEYEPYTNVQTAITNSIPDLMDSNIILNRPATLDENDRNDGRTNIKNDEIAIMTAIAAAGGAWQRRTPHATINILRADQLAAAESKRSTPMLYATNILRLCTIGWSQLEQSLEYERQIL